MKTKAKIVFALLFIIISSESCRDSNKQITTGELLKEMIDREQLTKFPDPFYQCKQFSSYDRASVAPDKPGWFANWDKSQFLRIEKNDGRREFVMFDAEGPGAVVRFWVTVASYGGNGILRFYLDGDETPTIEGEILGILSGDELIKYPLACSVSEESNYLQRGHNLYLPIPYSQRCKITYESDALSEIPGGQTGEAFYYNINYRTYERGTKIKTFTIADLQNYKDELEEAVLSLSNYDRRINAKAESIESDAQTIRTGEKFEQKISGGKAIRKLSLKLEADNYEQALRSTVLKIQFDGEQTVWCPVGDFFGTGYKLSPSKTWYTEVAEDGLLSCYWVMPFSQSCTITLENLGIEPVQIKNFELETSSYNWSKKSMYFGSGWYEQNHVKTRREPLDSLTPGVFDINYVTLTGKGVLVGDGVALYNTSYAWWGEGDEKIYVDNEDFPSHFGTGTEDYYGYAWCLPAKFHHPFIAQPDGSGSFNPGFTVNLRFRSLDAIPFTQNLKFDMELWHSTETTINHAPVSFWYMRPGGKTNRNAVPEQVKNPVSLKRSDILNITNDVKKDGRVEGEDLDIQVTSGRIRIQSDSRWSRESQFWWTSANPDDVAEMKFKVKDSGNYQINVGLTQAYNYAMTELSINNHTKKVNFDGYYQDGVVLKTKELGVFALDEGENTLKIRITGANPDAKKSYMVGVDFLDVKKQ